MTYDPASHRRRSIRLPGYDYAQAGAYFVTLVTNARENLFGEIVNAEMQLNEYGKIAAEQWCHLPDRFGSIELDAFVIMPNHIHGIIVIHDTVGAGFTPAQNDEPPNIGVGAGFTPAQNNEPPNIGVGARITPAQNDEPPNIGVGAGFTPAQNDEPPNIGVGAGFTPAMNVEPPYIGVGASPTPTQPQNGQPRGLPLRVTVGNIVGAYKSLVANECLKIYKSKNELMGKLWQRNYYEHIIRDEKSYQNIAAYIQNNPAHWEMDKLFTG